MAFLLTLSLWFGLVYGFKKKSLLKGLAAGVFFIWPLLKFTFYAFCVGLAFMSMATLWLLDWGFDSKPRAPRMKVRPASFERPRAAKLMKGHA